MAGRIAPGMGEMIAAGISLSLILLLAVVSPVLASPKQPVVVTPEMIEEAAALKQREEGIAAREEEVARREKELAGLQQEVDVKVARLTELQQDLQAKIDYINGLNVRDREFKNLIKIYSEMSASKVAPLVNAMTDSEATKILRALKSDQTAKIVPKLEAEKAVRVSRLLGLLE